MVSGSCFVFVVPVKVSVSYLATKKSSSWIVFAKVKGSTSNDHVSKRESHIRYEMVQHH